MQEIMKGIESFEVFDEAAAGLSNAAVLSAVAPSSSSSARNERRRGGSDEGIYC
jgi:hypothetical protein